MKLRAPAAEMLGKKLSAAGKQWSVTWFTVLGLVLDLLFKRAGRAAFLKNVDAAVTEVVVHNVVAWGGETYARKTTKKATVSASMAEFAMSLVIGIREVLCLTGQWVAKRVDQDLDKLNVGLGAVDGVLENCEGEIALLEVKVRPLGKDERAAPREALRQACEQTFAAFSGSGAAATWAQAVVVTCFVKEAGAPSSDDYFVAEWWPRDQPQSWKSRVFRGLLASRAAPAPKPLFPTWSVVRTKLTSKPAATLTEQRRTYYRVRDYLECVGETDVSRKVARWEREGYLTPADVLRRGGAVVKKGRGASKGKRKGASAAVYIAAPCLNIIHLDKITGKL